MKASCQEILELLFPRELLSTSLCFDLLLFCHMFMYSLKVNHHHPPFNKKYMTVWFFGFFTDLNGNVSTVNQSEAQ